MSDPHNFQKSQWLISDHNEGMKSRIFMPPPTEGRMVHMSRSHICVCHVRNHSVTNVTVYIQVYTQVYLHIYIHIYVQFAHNNFDTIYATKLKFGMIFTQTKT